jgi:hypothetical protein
MHRSIAMNAVEEERTARLRAIHSQAAVVRALLNELERADARWSGSLNDQLIEEHARLGCRMLEIGAAMRTSPRLIALDVPHEQCRRPWDTTTVTTLVK